MNILDLITTSVLRALGCSMDTFLRCFPAAESMYQVFLALAIGLILMNWVWQLPYSWVLTKDLPPLKFANFNSVITVVLGVCANGAVSIATLILLLVLAWNYIKLLFEAAERYILLGVLVYTAPVPPRLSATFLRAGACCCLPLWSARSLQTHCPSEVETE